MRTRWPDLLRALSQHLISVCDDYELERLRKRMPTQLAAGDFTRPGATEAAIAAREEQLGIRLPADYRAFLGASNGFPNVAGFPIGICGLDPVEEIGWARDRDRRTGRLAAYRRDFGAMPPAERPEDWNVDPDELERTLLIGRGDGNEYVLLLPPGPRNEWELWTYHHECGFTTGGSFEELMRDGLEWAP